MDRIKRYVLNFSFVRDALKEAERQGSIDAFSKARADLEETNVYDTDTKAKALASEMLNDLLSPVDLRKIVTFDEQKGIIFIGAEKVDPGRLNNLKNEAEFFMSSDLWHLLYETPKELASRAMFVSGETLADMQKGKSILYTLSTQDRIIRLFRSFVGKPQPPGK